MNVNIVINNNDITYRLIDYTRDENICNASGFINFTLEGTDPTFIALGQIAQLFEDNTLKDTYNVDTITVNVPNGSLEIHATNNEKKLEDTFIPDLYYLKDDPFLKTRYWLEKFLVEAGISYSFSVDGDGEYLMEDEVLGGTSVSELIIKLLSYSGWYLKFSPSGVAIIGKLDYSLDNYSQSYDDSVILDIDNVLDDSTLRNRAVVWGRTHPRTGEWIYSDMSIDTPWNYDENDKRTVLITNPYIATEEVAASIASQALKTFSKPKYVKKVRLAGASNVFLGDIVMINSIHFRGTGLVTGLASEMGVGGLITSLTLDYPCPRLIGALTYTSEDSLNYVYVGTQGNGVWRRHLTSSSGVWQNFSTGLLDLSIIDLDVNNGVFACVTSGGSLYTRYLDENHWNRYDPGVFNDGLGNYVSSGVFCTACAIDKITTDIYGVHNLKSGFKYSGGDWHATPGVRSWVTTITGSGGSLVTSIVYTGSGLSTLGTNEVAALDIDNNGDGTYITCMTVPNETGGGDPLIPEPPGGFHSVRSIGGVNAPSIGLVRTSSIHTNYNYNSLVPTISGAVINMTDIGGTQVINASYGQYVYYFDVYAATPSIARYNYKDNTIKTVTSTFTGSSSPYQFFVYNADIVIIVPDFPINNGVYREWYVEVINFDVGMATRELVDIIDTTNLFYVAKYKTSWMFRNKIFYVYEYGDAYYKVYDIVSSSFTERRTFFDVLTPTYKPNFEMHSLGVVNERALGYITYKIDGVYHYYTFYADDINGIGGFNEITGVPGTRWVPDFNRVGLAGVWQDTSGHKHFAFIDYGANLSFDYEDDNVYTVCSSNSHVYYITLVANRFYVYEYDGTLVSALDPSLNAINCLFLPNLDDYDGGIITFNFADYVVEKHLFDPYTKTTIISNIPHSIFIWSNFIGEKIIIEGQYIYWLDTDDEPPPGDGGGGSVKPILNYRNTRFSGVGFWTLDAYHIDMSQSFPSILYGGGGDGVLSNGTLVIYDTDWNSQLVNLLYSGEEGVRGGNEVTDVKSYTETTVSGFFRRSIFATNSPTSSGTSFIRILDYDDRLISNPSFNTYETKNETIQFRGTINHLETSNNNDKPFMFASTKILESGSKFYQRNGYDLRDSPQEFIDKSSGLPGAEISVIRTDDTI